MPDAARKLPQRARDSLLAALAAERGTLRALALWAITLVCLVILAGPGVDFSALFPVAF